MTWQIDPNHSSIGFAVKHMLVASVKGSFHDFDIDAEVDEQNLAASLGTVRVRTASIDTRDDNRDAHLRSPDFFDTENHPEMVFAVKSIEPNGNDDYKIVGDLTIRDITREVVLEADAGGPFVDPWGNRKIGLSAEGKLNRKDFGLNWNAALETGGFIVGDTVRLSVDLEFVNAA